MKKGVMKTVFGEENRKSIIDEVLAYTPNEDIYEARMCEALLKELTELHQCKKYSVFHKKLYDLFGEQLEEENFVKWLTDKMNIRKARFIESVNDWKLKGYQ